VNEFTLTISAAKTIECVKPVASAGISDFEWKRDGGVSFDLKG
jgi:hypothetical protein